jgi:hypothetical protein
MSREISLIWEIPGNYIVPSYSGGAIMPDFAIVSVQDAKLKTIPSRQRTYLNEYAGYIQQLSPRMAGKIRPLEDEKLTTIRRRLAVAAQTLDTTLIIRRSGTDLYFWLEPAGGEQPRRRTTRRRRSQEETPIQDQSLIEPGFPASATSLTS